MQGLTDYITESRWEELLTVIYVLIDDEYQALPARCKPNRRSAPVSSTFFSDSEVITIALFAEMIFGGAEDKVLAFIRQYHLDLFPDLLDPSRFNRRRRQVTDTMEALRCRLRDHWHSLHPLDATEAAVRLVDSAPIPICSYMRGGRCQSIALEGRAAWFGYCASKKMKFFGARCHALTTPDQMIDTWLLAPASYEDRQPLAALLDERQALLLIGDKGYVSADLEESLWQADEHLLLALKRKNQKAQWPSDFQRLLSQLRHRVETAFSVLTTVFTFEMPRSRSLPGLLARITTKILAHTLSFFLAEHFTPHLFDPEVR